MTKHRKKIVFGVLLILGIVLVRVFNLDRFFTLEALKSHGDQLKAFVSANYLWSVILFVIIYLLSVSLSVPGATFITVAGGYLYGTFEGASYSWMGASGGAILIFLLSRYFIGDYVQKKYKKQLKTFNEELAKNAISYLLTLRFIVLIPFFLINLLSGVTKIPLRTYTWTTMVGIIPGGLIFSYAGSQLGTIEKVNDVLTFDKIMALVLLAVLAISPVIYKHLKRSTEISNK